MSGPARSEPLGALFGLTGRVVLVTGGSGGIGGAVADLFTAAGAQVVAADIRWPAGPTGRPWEAETEGPTSPVVDRIELDVTDAEGVERRTRDIAARYGRLDVLVHAAGVTDRTPSLSVDLADWDRLMAVNLRSTFICSRAAARSMIGSGGGSIVTISSQLALAPPGGRAAYVASKAGVVGLTRTLAVEWASSHVRVNTIAPGVTRTPMIDAIEADPAERQRLLERIPLGRFGEPDEIAAAALFLASSAATYVTGAVLVVDGGYTVR